MSRKMEFVQRAGEPGAKLAPICAQFGISRQTGYKWLRRFREQGFAGLEEESRRPKSSPLSLAEDVVASILDARDAHPSWGPKKLQQLLRRRFGPSTPSRSTVARVLQRFGRIRKRRARGLTSVVEKAPSVTAAVPNDVWTVDFKGWWHSHDGVRCEPLTVRDACTRYLLAVRLTRTSVEQVRPIFEALFRKQGLPAAIQCDNGTPFINVQSRAGCLAYQPGGCRLGFGSFAVALVAPKTTEDTSACIATWLARSSRRRPRMLPPSRPCSTDGARSSTTCALMTPSTARRPLSSTGLRHADTEERCHRAIRLTSS